MGQNHGLTGTAKENTEKKYKKQSNDPENHRIFRVIGTSIQSGYFSNLLFDARLFFIRGLNTFNIPSACTWFIYSAFPRLPTSVWDKR